MEVWTFVIGGKKTDGQWLKTGRRGVSWETFVQQWHEKVGTAPHNDELPDPNEINDIQEITAIRFPKGIVPYYVDSNRYDSLITKRLKNAMDLIEASSCVEFHEMRSKPTEARNSTWVHFTNPARTQTCVHEPWLGENGELMMVIGFNCMRKREILHALLHAIGFKDEVAHPHRDQYIRIVWQNIQPAYRTLFSIRQEDAPYKVVEYDPMSIMHFHDRAFSINGGPTITPKMPGLQIAPSDKLSQLDVMKLRLWFGHECNKRKVGDIFENCKMVFHKSPSNLAGLGIFNEDDVADQSVNVDKDDSFEAWKLDRLPQTNENAPKGGQGPDNGGSTPEAAQCPKGGALALANDGKEGDKTNQFDYKDGDDKHDVEMGEGAEHEDGQEPEDGGLVPDHGMEGDKINQFEYKDGDDKHNFRAGEGAERRVGMIKDKVTTNNIVTTKRVTAKSNITARSKVTITSKTTPKSNVTTKSKETVKGKVTINSKVTAKSEVTPKGKLPPPLTSSYQPPSKSGVKSHLH